MMQFPDLLLREAHHYRRQERGADHPGHREDERHPHRL